MSRIIFGKGVAVSQFEFFMTFYSLLLGLAAAELLLGFTNLLRNRARPRLGLLTPLIGALIFLQLMTTFVDAWDNLQAIGIHMRGLALPTGIAVLLFCAAVVTLPRDVTEWVDLDEYFYRNRRYSVGAYVAVNVLILFNEAPRIPSQYVLPYTVINVVAFSLMAGALLLRTRLAIAACLIVMIALQAALYSDLGIFRIIARLTA